MSAREGERERERKEEGKPGLGDKFEMRYIKIKGVRYRSFCPLQPCKIGGRQRVWHKEGE